MYSCRIISNLIQHRKRVLSCCTVIIKRGYKPSNSFPTSSSHCGYDNSFKLLQHNFQLQKNTLYLSRDFSGTVALWSRQGSAQDKEKLKNYLLYGGITLFAASIFVGLVVMLRLDKSHDRVFIDRK